ncbi:hypothetical protein K3495_g13256 [Podosphaera aphanis]|nr:hypothetical protein K3495_g13256 [Podosphaera aphanis]
MADLQPEDIKGLEQTRQRLHQLSSNIASLKQDVLLNAPLPKWHSLQASAMILTNNIQVLTTLLAKNSEILNRAVVYPSTNYPGRTQEGLLGQLLRKKLEPSIEGWVDTGKEMGATVNDAEESKLKSWAAEWIATRVAKYALEEARDEYTVEERELGIENVRTGLLNEDEDLKKTEKPFGMGTVDHSGSQLMHANSLLILTTTGKLVDPRQN